MLLTMETEEGATKCGAGGGRGMRVPPNVSPRAANVWGHLKRTLSTVDVGWGSDGATQWGDLGWVAPSGGWRGTVSVERGIVGLRIPSLEWRARKQEMWGGPGSRGGRTPRIICMAGS